MRLLRPAGYAPTIGGLSRNFLAREAIYPFYASFKVTSRCHFGCPFCNIRKNKCEDLTTDEIKAILDNLSRSPILMTSFEGGEPLLRDDIEELLRYARTKDFYLLFTTSDKKLLDRPLERYAPLIDFLHISIDEGHGNLEMFDLLPRLCALPTQVSVQTVVTRDSVDAIDEKVEKCHRAGANIVIIPASPMDDADDCFPDIDALEKRMLRLRRQFPDTIHTPQGYFGAYRQGRCSSASVIIAPDGRLYYPCHIQATKGPDLRTQDLSQWLRSEEAKTMRISMRQCGRNCGWYQYYAIHSYVSPSSVWEALRPMLFQKKKNK